VVRKILIIFIMLISLCTSCFASSLHDIQDSIGTDKYAHFGVGYVVSNELQHVGMSKLEAVVTVAFLAYAKEKWVDDTFSKSDVGATVLGGVIPLYKKEFN
jgi:hypothetical protein